MATGFLYESVLHQGLHAFPVDLLTFPGCSSGFRPTDCSVLEQGFLAASHMCQRAPAHAFAGLIPFDTCETCDRAAGIPVSAADDRVSVLWCSSARCWWVSDRGPNPLHSLLMRCRSQMDKHHCSTRVITALQLPRQQTRL